MESREIWEFLREGRHHVIREWCVDCEVSSRDRAKMDACLDRLRTLDFALVKGKLLAGPLRGGTKLYKLRVRGENRELRPLLCRGPVGNKLDYTLLQGAIEVGSKLRPANAEDRAGKHHGDLIKNSHWRALY